MNERRKLRQAGRDKLSFVSFLAIKQSNENGISAVSNEAEPLSYALVRNYPNPFSP